MAEEGPCGAAWFFGMSCASLRARYFDELEAVGINPMMDEVPEAYRSSAWWSGRFG